MKKFIAVILSIMMVVTLTPTVAFAGAQPSDWAKDEVNEAGELGLTTAAATKDYTKNITREEFCELVVTMYDKAMNDNSKATEDPFNDTDNAYVLKAYKLGIVKGVSSTEFAPNNSITRQEICTMLMRAYKLMDSSVKAPSGIHIFTDSSKIAEWAFESVQIAFDRGIMKGVGNDRIDPLGNTTCEQSILLVLRLYNKVAGAPAEEPEALELEFEIKTDDNSIYSGKEKVVDSYFEEIEIKGKSVAAEKINGEMTSMKQAYIDRLEEIKEIRKEREEDMFNYVNTVDADITQNDTGIFSVKFTWCWFAGGVCNEDIKGATYSTKTGERIDIMDVFSRGEEYELEDMINEMSDYIDNNTDIGWNENAKELIKGMESCDFNYYVEGDKVYITFNTYEIADGASGSIVIPVMK